MRINSLKQTEASRRNGSKGKGPTSEKGKQTSRFNGLKDGLFSKELVIASAGERQDEFEQLKAELWTFFQPASTLEEMLVADFVENWWRRQRIRRAESAELTGRLETLRIRHDLRCSDDVESLKVRFLSLVASYQAARTPRSPKKEDMSEIAMELEHTREQLASTSVGLKFLVDTMRNIEKEAASNGQVSAGSEALILACCGLANELATRCVQLNKINRAGSHAVAEKDKPEQTTNEKRKVDDSKAQDQTEYKEQMKSVLVMAISSGVKELIFRRKILEGLEDREAKTLTAVAVLPPENASDRFSKAETAIERRMYRALGMLLAIRQSAGPQMLP